MTLIDLHCHTTASDGTLAPSELVELSASRDVGTIALTDHDTVAGFDEAAAAGGSLGVRVVPGIELSTRTDDRSIHVLGYFIDPHSRPLLDALAEMRIDRADRMRRMVENLRGLGMDVTLADVEAQARGAILARPHVARALVAKGYIESVRQAFTPELIADGGRADAARKAFSSVEAIELIRAAGGVAVLAHPGLLHHLGTHDPVSEALIEGLANAGLAGLEVDHPDHSQPMRDLLGVLAERLSLIPTGGSDFHGETGRLGGCSTSADSLERLERLARG